MVHRNGLQLTGRSNHRTSGRRQLTTRLRCERQTALTTEQRRYPAGRRKATGHRTRNPQERQQLALGQVISAHQRGKVATATASSP